MCALDFEKPLYLLCRVSSNPPDVANILAAMTMIEQEKYRGTSLIRNSPPP